MNRVHAQSPDDVSSGRATGDSVEIKESRRGGASGTGDDLWQPTTLAKREEDVSPSAGQQLHHPTPIVPDVSRSSENIDIENCCYHSEDSNDLAVAAIIGCTDIDQVRFLPYHRHLQPTTTFSLDFLHSTFLFILKTFLKIKNQNFIKSQRKSTADIYQQEGQPRNDMCILLAFIITYYRTIGLQDCIGLYRTSLRRVKSNHRASSFFNRK